MGVIGSSDRTLNNGDITLIQLDKSGHEIDRYTTGEYLEDWLQNLTALPDGRCFFTGTTYSYESPVDCNIKIGMAQFSISETENSSQKNPANFQESKNNNNGGNGCFIHSLQL